MVEIRNDVVKHSSQSAGIEFSNAQNLTIINVRYYAVFFFAYMYTFLLCINRSTKSIVVFVFFGGFFFSFFFLFRVHEWGARIK